MKKLLLPSITLLAGLLIGYFGRQMLSERKVELTSARFNASTSFKAYSFLNPKDVRITNPDDARKYIQSYADINRQDIANNGGLFAFDPIKGKEPLDGFVIDRTSILDIISKNKDWTGIRVYFAKNPDYATKPDRIFTFIFTAALSSNKPGALANDEDSTDPIYDHVYPCPTVCGSLAPNN